MDDVYVRKRKAKAHVASTKKRRRLRFRIVLCVVLVFVLFAWWFINSKMYPAIAALSEAKVRSIATNALLDSILLAISSDMRYENLLNAYDDGEHVYMLSTNTQGMNSLAAKCTQIAQDKLSMLGAQGIKIALGTLTSTPLLSGMGPDVKVEFEPFGSVESSFESSLTNSGINQTLYRVNIVLNADVYIVLPGVTRSVRVQAQAAVAESVIVGEVPQVFTDVADNEDMLNLIPTEIQD